MDFHAVTRPSTHEDLSIEDQLATNVTNVGLILTKSQRQTGSQAQGFGILKWKHVGTQKIDLKRSKLVVSHRFLISYMRHASLENGDA